MEQFQAEVTSTQANLNLCKLPVIKISSIMNFCLLIEISNLVHGVLEAISSEFNVRSFIK